VNVGHVNTARFVSESAKPEHPAGAGEPKGRIKVNYFTTVFSSQAFTLRLPSDVKADVELYVAQHQKGTVSMERAPFRRQLDLWAFALATALSESLDPRESPSSKWGTKFADTRSVQLPDALCDLLAVVALSRLGPENEAIDDPAQIIELGNCLAGAGCPLVIAQLKSPDLRVTTLEKALEFASSLRAKMSDASEV
jgi:hypothetical protein